MGEPALLRVVRRLMAARKMSDTRKLVVLLPGDKIEPGLAERVRAALQRYCTLKLEDNDAQLRLMRREAGRLLLRGMLILLVCVGVSSVFRSETITFLPPLINNALGEGFNVIGWVMLWAPVEAYFFDPIPIRTSSTVHRFLESLQIEIRPQRPPPLRRRFDPYQPANAPRRIGSPTGFTRLLRAMRSLRTRDTSRAARQPVLVHCPRRRMET